MIKNCEQCSKEFNNRKTIRFCSTECYFLSRREMVVCQQCNKEFEVRKSTLTQGKGKYCSRGCANLGLIKAPQSSKICSKCGEEKSIDDYCKNSSWCKSCSNKLRKEDYKTIHGRWLGSKSRANYRKGEGWWNLTEEIFGKLISKPCYYCGGKLNLQGCGLDRKDNSRGYDDYNVVPCCGQCNAVKLDHLSFEEMMLLSPILEHIRLKREGYNFEENLSEELVNHC